MSTTWTPSLRLTQPSVNDPATGNLWGGMLNTDMALIDAAITGTVSVSIAGVSSLTLSANNGAADQSRPFGLIFTGAPTGGECTVTLPPGVIKFGAAQNQSSGIVTLTTGSGTVLALAAGATQWTLYYCDGTNVTALIAPAPRGALVYSANGTTTWTPLANVTLAKFTVIGRGGAGGAGSGGAGGGGGGAAGAVVAWVPVLSTDTFTLSTNYDSLGGAQVTSASNDVVVTGNVGSSGVFGGGAGGTANSIGTTRAGCAFAYFPGQPGGTGALLQSGASSYVSLGGPGGNGYLGGGAPLQISSVSNVSSPAASTIYGSGGAGGAGNAVGGTGGGPLVMVEW
jgi:hypothetical protein